MTQILTHHQIIQKLRRISYAILEKNLYAKRILLAGLNERGYYLAKLLEKELVNISKSEIDLIQIDTTKNDFNLPNNAKNSTVILVDDVLNSGGTLAQALVPFIQANCDKIEVAVLADRNHRKRPIKANYVGISLATTLQEHIYFNTDDKKKLKVYLE